MRIRKLAREPEAPGAEKPHAGICEGGRRATCVPTLIGQETPPLVMWNIVTAILLLTSYAFGGEWVVTKGGLSSDKKLVIAVFPQKTEFIDEADDTVLLVDQIRGIRIGPLEEASSSCGTWGTTTTNVQCIRSPDSTILVVNFCTGRLMHSLPICRIRDRRAVPIGLPDSKSHPKGTLLEGLGTMFYYGFDQQGHLQLHDITVPAAL